MIEPRDIYIDPTCTHLWERWWHKFMFWKKFKYQEFYIKTKRVSLKELETINNDK